MSEGGSSDGKGYPKKNLLIAGLLGALFVVSGIILASTSDKDPITADMRNAATLLLNYNNSDKLLWHRLAEMCDTFGPRFSGSENLEEAMDWIIAEARADGLNPITQEVPVPKWERGIEWGTLHLRGPGNSRDKPLTLIGLGMTAPTNGTIRAPVVVVNSLRELATCTPNQYAGQIILFNNVWEGYGNTVVVRNDGPREAARCGASAVLIKSVTPYSLQSPHTGLTNSTIGSAAISNEDAAQIQRMFDRSKRNSSYSVEVSLHLESTFVANFPSRNIIIDIPGTIPGEFVIISGHIDSWDNGEGAMDDGGGALASWHAVKMIHDLKLTPKRTIRAILYTNEENGVMGGKTYAATPVGAPLDRTSIAMESDIGAFQPYRLSFTGSNTAFNTLTKLGRLLSPIKAGGVVKGFCGVDIDPLRELGVPCAGFEVRDFRLGSASNNPCKDFSTATNAPNGDNTEAYFWYHHTSADTVDKIDPDQLQATAASMAVWAYSVAALDNLLHR